MSSRAFLGLGANLGDRWSALRHAASTLPDVAGASSVYETDPVGGPDGQGPYLNCVLQLDTELGPRALLRAAAAAEADAGRVRTVRWGSRTLDVDVLWIDGVTVSQPDLVIPHPRLWERAFVLVPLAELAPDLATAERLAAVAGDLPAVRFAGQL